MNVLKCMHNFYSPEFLEIMFEIIMSRNIIDICESSLVARADSNSCRDFECFLYSHKLSLFDEVELSLRSADRGRADCYPHTFSKLAVTFACFPSQRTVYSHLQVIVQENQSKHSTTIAVLGNNVSEYVFVPVSTMNQYLRKLRRTFE